MKNWFLIVTSFALVIFLTSCSDGRGKGGEVGGVSTDPSSFAPTNTKTVSNQNDSLSEGKSVVNDEFKEKDCPVGFDRVTSEDFTEATFRSACTFFGPSPKVLAVEQIEVLDEYDPESLKVRARLNLEIEDEFQTCPFKKDFIFQLSKNLDGEWEYNSTNSYSTEMFELNNQLAGERIECTEQVQNSKLEEAQVVFQTQSLELVSNVGLFVGRVPMSYPFETTGGIFLTVELTNGQTAKVGGERESTLYQIRSVVSIEPGYEYFIVPQPYNFGLTDWPSGTTFKVLAYSFNDVDWTKIN